MRIKKPHNKINQDITFDTILKRNKAIKMLVDGDLVKVLDASQDPLIKNGWAIYRFCFESQSFDLIEKQEEETLEMILPDYKTCSKGINSDGKEIIIVPDLMRVYDKSVSFLKDFDFDVSLSKTGFWNKVKIVPNGMTDGILKIPVETDSGIKTMNLKTGYSLTYTLIGNVCHVVFKAYLCNDENDNTATYYTEFDKDNGYCQELNREVKPNGGGSIPLMIVKFKVDENKNFIGDTIHVFKLWKNHVNPIVETDLKVETVIDIAARDGLKDDLYNGQLVKVYDASGDANIDSGWAVYRFLKNNNSFELVSQQVVKQDIDKIYPDDFTINKYDLNDGKRPTFAVIDAMKGFRQNQILLGDFDYQIAYSKTWKSFNFTPNGATNGKVPIKINGVTKFLVIASGGIKRSLLPTDATVAYFLIKGYVVDTIGDVKNTIAISYGTEVHQVRPFSNDVFIPLFQMRVNIPPEDGEIDQQSVYMCKYWKHALAPLGELMDYRLANP